MAINEENYAYFYNSENEDRVYDADSFSSWLGKFFTNGVFNGELQVVEDSGMNILVKGGYACIGGKTKIWETPTSLTVQPSDPSLDRIDNIVIRRDDVRRDFFIEVVQGTLSGSPVAPTPTREDGIYDLVLAQITVKHGDVSLSQAEIRDTRMDTNLCGWVATTVTQITYDQAMAQFESYYVQFKNGNEADFNKWFDTIKDTLSGDVAGKLTTAVTELQGQVTRIKRNITVPVASIVANTDANTKTVYPYVYNLAFTGVTATDIADASLGANMQDVAFGGCDSKSGSIDLLFTEMPTAAVTFSFVSAVKPKEVS